MKSIFAFLVFAIGAAANAAPAVYSCRIVSVSPEEIYRSQYSTNIQVAATDCSPKDEAGLTRLGFTAPASARSVLEAAIADRRVVALTTPQPVAYGGTIIGVDSLDVGPLQAIEYAQFYVYNRSETDSALKAEVRRVLDLRGIKRVPRTDHSRGKTLETWSREIELVVDQELTISFSESGKSLSYGQIRPPASDIRAEYVKKSRSDMGRVLDAQSSARVSSLLGSRFPYTIKGLRMSSNDLAQIRFSKTAAGFVQVQLAEGQ